MTTTFYGVPVVTLDRWQVQQAIYTGVMPPELAVQVKNWYRMETETSADSEDKQQVGAFKLDQGKAPVYQGFIKYFPRAIEAVANVSKFGHEKYGTWGGWLDVEDGANRYLDAKCRHMIEEAKGEERAQDSELRHAEHEAWGAMARLELMLRKADGTD